MYWFLCHIGKAVIQKGFGMFCCPCTALTQLTTVYSFLLISSDKSRVIVTSVLSDNLYFGIICIWEKLELLVEAGTGQALFFACLYPYNMKCILPLENIICFSQRFSFQNLCKLSGLRSCLA